MTVVIVDLLAGERQLVVHQQWTALVRGAELAIENGRIRVERMAGGRRRVTCASVCTVFACFSVFFSIALCVFAIGDIEVV